MLRGSLLILSALLTLNTAHAALLEYQNSTNKLENVTLANSAKIVESQEELTQTGAGVRKKKIVFVKVDVYVAQLFLSNPTQFKMMDSQPVDKIGGQKAVALQIHLLRNLDSSKMKSAFEESLKKNKVDVKSELVTEFFKILDEIKEVKEGQTLTILAQKISDTEDRITVEDAAGKTYEIKKPTGAVKTLFSIWLGEMADNEMLELKKALLKGAI